MELRRQSRIVFQTKIRLRAPGRDESVVARVQNLSPRGVYITGTELPAAGTEVQCRLVLAGERRTLRGRVAWVRPASPSTPLKVPGAGIEFLELGQKDADLLHKLVDPGDEERQPVDVWFEGMKAPIRCQAVVAGEGVRLATRLPFMRLNSPVRVAFTQPEVMVREGTLDSVMLEPNDVDGIPHLQVNVSMAPQENAQGTIDIPVTISIARDLGPEGPITPPASTVVDPTVSAPPPAAMVAHDTIVERERTDRFPAVTPLAASPWREQLRVKAQQSLNWLSRGTWRPAGAGFVAGALAVGLVVGIVRPTVSAPAAIQAAVSRRASSPVAVAVAPDPEPPGPPEPVVAPEPVAEIETAEAGPALARHQDLGDGVTVTTDGDGIRLTVAITGSGKGAEQFRMAEPFGLAVTLPRARPRLTSNISRPGGGPVRLQVRRRPQGSQLRFFFDPAKHKGRLTVDTDQVVLDLDKR
jgi:PilZ domain